MAIIIEGSNNRNVIEIFPIDEQKIAIRFLHYAEKIENETEIKKQKTHSAN